MLKAKIRESDVNGIDQAEDEDPTQGSAVFWELIPCSNQKRQQNDR